MFSKNQVFDENTFFEKMTMSMFLENAVFGSPCGVAPQQNKGCKHIPEHSRPNSDQILFKNCCFHSNFDEHQQFSIKIAKQIKIVAKALPRILCCLGLGSLRRLGLRRLGLGSLRLGLGSLRRLGLLSAIIYSKFEYLYIKPGPADRIEGSSGIFI